MLECPFCKAQISKNSHRRRNEPITVLQTVGHVSTARQKVIVQNFFLRAAHSFIHSFATLVRHANICIHFNWHMSITMDIASVSSNWKTLQKKLQSEKPKPSGDGTSSQHSNKRKKPHDQISSSAALNGPAEAKKRKTAQSRGSLRTYRTPTQSFNRSNMSASLSSKPSTASAVLLDDDIPAASILQGPSSEPFVPNLGLGYPDSTSEKHKYLAVDCEMVGTGPPPHSDSQLARVSITNYHGAVVYDTYVLPVMEVTDYRTAVSGIRPEHLKPGVARSFNEVRATVEELLADRVLVGHAIHHDLHALMLSHKARDIRDTARHKAYKALAGGRTPALKRLASELLGVEIQKGEHSSVEDARASMALYRREKNAFEQEIVKRFGGVRVAPVKSQQELDEDEEMRQERAERRKARLKKKNQKKKGRK